MPPNYLAILFVILFPIAGVFGTLSLLIWTYHRRKMEEIRQRREGNSLNEIRAEVGALRQEVQALRDTSMQYDLSLDNALQQVDRRLSYLERKPLVTSEQVEPQNLTLGSR